jgi:dynactin complex subunit
VQGYGQGFLRYYGPCPFGNGPSDPWLGVELVEPIGTCNGAIEGEQYFTCAEKHGLFVALSDGAVQIEVWLPSGYSLFNVER